MNKRTLNKVRKALESVQNEISTRGVDTKVSPTVFISDDGRLHISGEDGYMFVDYYGEFRGGYPWIDPRLEEIAKANKCYWEWDNPGSICLVD